MEIQYEALKTQEEKEEASSSEKKKFNPLYILCVRALSFILITFELPPISYFFFSTAATRDFLLLDE